MSAILINFLLLPLAATIIVIGPAETCRHIIKGIKSAFKWAKHGVKLGYDRFMETPEQKKLRQLEESIDKSVIEKRMKIKHVGKRKLISRQERQEIEKNVKNYMK